MAYDAFIKMDGIDGDSTAKGHEKWIELLSFSWGCSNTATGGEGGGGGEGKAMTTDLEFVANFSGASPALLEGCSTGRHFRSADLEVGKSGDTAFYKAHFEDILISSYQTGASIDAFPTESVRLDFVKGEYV
jgi:type VI secretion system secreted protein Hcp